DIGKVNDETALDHFAAHLADKRRCGPGGAAGGNQVVDEEDAVALRDCIDVDLDAIDAVLELVVVPDGFRGKLAFLADRHEAGAEEVRDGSADDEAPRLDRRDLGDPLA